MSNQETIVRYLFAAVVAGIFTATVIYIYLTYHH
jgi:hypothetical protein